MAGVGEAGAIVGLISTAASLSKAVVDIASKYKVARLQIEFFGKEVGILGHVLDQLHRLYSKDDLWSDGGVISLTTDILNQCSGLFADLETYRDTLYSRTGSVRIVKLRGKTKWVFEVRQLEYLRTRVESMKMNMLLMMTMQCVYGLQRSNVGGSVENHTEQAQILSIQSVECAKRLQALKNNEVISASTDANSMINRISIDTTASVRSIVDSILSLYGHESLYETPWESQGEPLGTTMIQVDLARASRIVEDHIRKIAMVDEDRPDSPFISPSASRYALDSSTASDDQAIEYLKVEHFNHLAATELGIWTDSGNDGSDQHQYDSERIISGFFLRNTCGSTLKDSYIPVLLSAVDHYEKGRDWMRYELCITIGHRVRYLQLDEKPMVILDLLVRQLPLHDGFKLRQLAVAVPWEYVEYDLDAMTYRYPINRQYCCHEVLAAMLNAIDDSYVASSYELCINNRGELLTSRLRMDQKPLALYQQWLQEGRNPFFLIRLRDAGTHIVE